MHRANFDSKSCPCLLSNSITLAVMRECQREGGREEGLYFAASLNHYGFTDNNCYWKYMVSSWYYTKFV